MNLTLNNFFLIKITFGFFLILSSGCFNEKKSKPYFEKPESTKQIEAAPEELNEQTIKKYLINSRWLLEYELYPFSQEAVNNLPKLHHRSLTNDKKIRIDYQAKYIKLKDEVEIDDYKSNFEYEQTFINDNSVKNKLTRKSNSSYEYEVVGKDIIQILRYGINKERETRATLSVEKIDSQVLIFSIVYNDGPSNISTKD